MVNMWILRIILKESALNEQFYTESLKVACNLLKVYILSPFKGDAPFTVLVWRFFEEC